MPSPPLDIHEWFFGFLHAPLHVYVEEHDLGEVRGSRTPVILASDQVYEPDILFVARARANIIRGTAAYDRGPKLRGYERAGVQEVWLIDPYGPAGTEFYWLQEGRYVPAKVEDGVLRSIAIPGFAI